jgi:hypothetical protein
MVLSVWLSIRQRIAAVHLDLRMEEEQVRFSTPVLGHAQRPWLFQLSNFEGSTERMMQVAVEGEVPQQLQMGIQQWMH